MGEMADYNIDISMDEEMGDYFYGYHDDADRPPQTILKCKYCKEVCEWGVWKGKWRLFQSGELHKCSVNPLKGLKT